jgi:hypothetical protein
MYTTYEVDCNVVMTSMQIYLHKLISFQKAGGVAAENLNFFIELKGLFQNLLNVKHMQCSRNVSSRN